MSVSELYNKYEKYTGIFLTIVSICSALFAVDAYYAKAEAVEKLELRLEQKILSDREDRVQERIWRLEDRFVSQQRQPPEVVEQLRALNKEKADIMRKLNAIEKKTLDKK